MEEICKALSEKLKEGGEGVFAVFYEDELLDVLPEDERNRETLEAALKKLNNGGYIDVKYAKGSAFCLSFLRPYEAAKPAKASPDESSPSPARATFAVPAKIYVCLALCSFLGALAGGLCALLGAVI